MKYLYIHIEDGTMYQTNTSPSQEDLDSVEEGNLMVITYSEDDGFMDVDDSGDFLPVPTV